MLSEEALILAAVAGACVLLVLGVLELMWPTRPRPRRHPRPEPAQPRPILGAVPPRPAQSILPRRLIESPSAARPTGGFVFPPPADYVPPPLPREEIRPIRPAERPPEPSPPEHVAPAPPEPVPAPALEVPSFLIPVEEPVAPPEPHYVPPRFDAEPAAVQDEVERIETELPRVEPEPPTVEPEPEHVEARSHPTQTEPREIGDWFTELVAPPVGEAEPKPIDSERPPVQAESDEIEAFEFQVVDPEPRPVHIKPLIAELAPPLEEPTPPLEEPSRSLEEPIPPLAEFTPSAQTLSAFERVAPPAPEDVEPPQSAEPPPPPIRRRRSKVSPHARPHRVLRPAPPQARGIEQPPTDSAASARFEAPLKTPLPTSTGPAEIDTTLNRDSPLVERCFALYQDKRFDEVLTVGEEALGRPGREAGGASSRETAALWSVVGLAKQALGDDDGAHVALESSIDAASETERATYRRHLATLALEAAQSRLARAGSHDTDDRMAVIRSAIVWTERGLAVMASDQALADAREAAHDALWQAYEQAATALLQRQEFPGARQILHEALEDPKLPAVRAAGFRGLLSGTFGGEIGQLTAQAILSMQEGRESEALGTLQRAEELLQTIPTDSLPPTRRDEVDQRLWWGYAELGSRRLDAGDYEEALDPLLHALRFTSIGPERQAETGAAVVRALEGIAAVRALSIRRLAEAGSRDEAIVAAGELQGLVKRGLELGLSEDELAAAFARVRRLCEELGMDARA